MKYIYSGIIGGLVIALFLFLYGDLLLGTTKTYKLTYIVYYDQNHIDTTHTSYSGKKGYYFGSDRGTNFIKERSITGLTIYNSSAPYKVLSYTHENDN